MSTTKNTEQKVNKGGFKRFILLQLFLLYLIVLLYLCFFSETFGRYSHEDVAINLIPFREINRFFGNISSLGWGAFLINIFGNIVAFMPFGFFEAMFIKDGNIKKATVFSGFFSILIELMQLLTRVGTCDIDDVILNTLGALLGALIHKAIRGRFRVEGDNDGI